jgi:hypothetical protein
MLGSMIYPAVWKPERPVEALCATGSDTPCLITNLYHSCGVHAFTREDHALEYAIRFTKQNPAHVFVVGKVAGAGRVVEHELGWRAARAAILSLDTIVSARAVGTVGQDLLTQLRRRYRLALTLEVR